MRTWHLVTYDVRDDRHLHNVAQVLEGYGERVQYSVFRCQLTTTELQRLHWELLKIVATEDSVLLVPLCRHCAGRAHGIHRKQQWETETPSFRIL